jgi:hypothetical protein
MSLDGVGKEKDMAKEQEKTKPYRVVNRLVLVSCCGWMSKVIRDNASHD